MILESTTGSPSARRQFQTEMLVLDVAVEIARRRLENVGGRHAAGRDAPSAVLEEERGFRLRTGKTELAGIARNAPRGVVFPQGAQALRNGGFVQPFDLGTGP